MTDLQSALQEKGLAKESNKTEPPKKEKRVMKNYFHTDDIKKVVREEILTVKARDWAKSFIAPTRPGRGEKNPRLTSAQMRRFYTDAKSLEQKVNAQGFDKMKPLVKMTKSKVAYSCSTDGRERKVPIEFRKYIEEMIDNINDKNDFEAFMLCFEAVVGYFYGEGGR